MTRENQWSLLIARYRGWSLRVHLYFWLLAASTLYLSLTTRNTLPNQEDIFLMAIASLMVLAGSLLLHEMGHALAVKIFGGSMPTWVIGPVNGMGDIRTPQEPCTQVFIYLAGPVVNFTIAFVAYTFLTLVQTPGVAWLHLLHHDNWNGGVLLTGLQLVYTINWLLCLINLAPSLMFDGGRALRGALLWNWPGLGVIQAERWVASATRLLSATLLLLVMLSWQWGWAIDVYLVPLALFSVFLFFSSEIQPSRDMAPESARWTDDHAASAISATLRTLKETGASHSSPPAPPSPSSAANRPPEDWANSPPSFWQPILPNSEHSSPPAREKEPLFSHFSGNSAEAEAADDIRMDKLLIRVHEEGMDCLSSEEHAFLQKVSARYRERRHRMTSP
jgi:stage IV sporulation protein FB